MAHIMGITFVSNGQVFATDESGNHVFEASAPINAVTPVVSAGALHDLDFRCYVGTGDGNIAKFNRGSLSTPQFFHVTDYPVLWSLYHAAGVLYLGTGDFSSSGPFDLLALDDQTLAPRWRVSSPGPMMYPVGVAYTGNTPKQVIVSSGNPNPALRGLDVATGAELWSVPETVFGQKVHDGVVYYGELASSTLRARLASDGSLLWSFRNPRFFSFQVPMVAGGVVWASSAGNEVYALDASNGNALWEVALGEHPGVPAVGFDHPNGLSLVAVAEQNGISVGFLQGIDANTGARLWTSNVPVSQEGGSCTDPIVIPHFEGGLEVQVGTADGALMTFNPYDGQLLWQRQLTPGSSLLAKPHWVIF